MMVMARLGPLGNYPGLFGTLYAGSFVLMLLMVRLFPSDALTITTISIVILLWFCGRALFLGFPASNDVYRYIWEGHIQSLGYNPYLYAPDHPILTPIAEGIFNEIWQNINHKNAAACYPPLSLLIFNVLARINPHPFFFKLVMVGFDFGVMIITIRLIHIRRISVKWMLLYAANPLIILFIAGQGHLDVIQVFFLCLSLWLIYKEKVIAAFFMIGCAIMTKYIVIVVLPFLITGQNYKKAAAVLVTLVFFIPYAEAGPQLFQSITAFGLTMHYNDAITAILRLLFNDASIPIAVLLLGGCMAVIYLTTSDQLYGIYLAIGCTLLFLPTLHPWYLVLITPLIVFFPSRAWVYLMAATICMLPVNAIEYRTAIFQEIHWLKFFEYIPFFGLIILGMRRSGYWFQPMPNYLPPQSISVVVPVFNEARCIENCIKSLQQGPYIKEIIISDGGSTDDSRQMAINLGAIVVCGQKGRGPQIKSGLMQASGDVLLILHADCTLKTGADARLIKYLAAHPWVRGGGFGMQFDTMTPTTRCISFLNNLRARLFGIFFGDQGQFFRKQIKDVFDPLEDMMLMEDVELSLKLKERGRMGYLGVGVTASDRRWHGGAFWPKVALNLRLFLNYLIGRRLQTTDAVLQNYYDLYYLNR